MPGIVPLEDVSGNQSRPQPTDLIFVQLSHRISELLRRRPGQRHETVSGQLVEDLRVIGIHVGADCTLTAPFSQASVNMRCTEPRGDIARPSRLLGTALSTAEGLGHSN